MSPSLESIQALANSTNMVTNKVIDAAFSKQFEFTQNQSVRKSASEMLLQDIVFKISELVCENKQSLWLHCYNNDATKSGAVSANVWRSVHKLLYIILI